MSWAPPGPGPPPLRDVASPSALLCVQDRPWRPPTRPDGDEEGEDQLTFSPSANPLGSPSDATSALLCSDKSEPLSGPAGAPPGIITIIFILFLSAQLSFSVSIRPNSVAGATAGTPPCSLLSCDSGLCSSPPHIQPACPPTSPARHRLPACSVRCVHRGSANKVSTVFSCSL